MTLGLSKSALLAITGGHHKQTGWPKRELEQNCVIFVHAIDTILKLPKGMDLE
jgi:hypothetical protein